MDVATEETLNMTAEATLDMAAGATFEGNDIAHGSGASTLDVATEGDLSHGRGEAT